MSSAQTDHEYYMRLAMAEAAMCAAAGGRPYGSVIVHDGQPGCPISLRVMGHGTELGQCERLPMATGPHLAEQHPPTGHQPHVGRSQDQHRYHYWSSDQ